MTFTHLKGVLVFTSRTEVGVYSEFDGESYFTRCRAPED